MTHRKTTPQFTLKPGDTRPAFEDQLLDRGGDPVDLSTVTEVRFYFRHVRSGDLIVNSPATIEDAAAGEVSYTFSEGETALEGRHIAEWQVEYDDGGFETFPPDHNLVIEIPEDVAQSEELADIASPDASVGVLTVEDRVEMGGNDIQNFGHAEGDSIGAGQTDIEVHLKNG